MENRTGVYDPVSRTAYVQSGAGERATALHELVHALQDQHFDLRRAARASPAAATASLAAAGARSRGTRRSSPAVLVARSLSAHGEPQPDALPRARSAASRPRVGLRFAANLRNLGGNAARVLGSLRRFPATTEQVFHLDKFLERERPLPIVLPGRARPDCELAGDGTFGELDVRALLAVFGVPRLDHAGDGLGRRPHRDLPRLPAARPWRSRSTGTPERDAQSSGRDAVTRYVNEAFDAATRRDPRAPTACRRHGLLAASAARGDRVRPQRLRAPRSSSRSRRRAGRRRAHAALARRARPSDRPSL